MRWGRENGKTSFTFEFLEGRRDFLEVVIIKRADEL